jgi:hypothetical protein
MGKIYDLFIIVCALVAVACCYFLYLINVEDFIHSDIATDILTGREIFRQKTLFLHNYYHSTEIFILRPSLFMALWTFATDSMLTTFKLAVMTDILVQIVSFIYMVKRLGGGYKPAVLGIVAYFGTRTFVSGEFSGLGNSSYGTMCAIVFVLIGYYASSKLGKMNSTDRYVRLLMPLLAFLYGMSSMRFLATVLIPFVIAHCASKLWSRLPQDWTGDRVLREFLIWTVFCIAGLVVTQVFVVPKGFGPLPFQTLAANGLSVIWSDTLPKLILEIIKFNPIVQVAGEFRFITLPGIVGFLSVIFVVVCVFGLFRTTRPLYYTRASIYRYLAVSVVVMALTMITTLDAIAVKLRYLVICYIFMALIVSLMYEDMSLLKPVFSRIFLTLVCGFVTLNCIHNMKELPKIVSANPSKIVVRHVREIATSLERHGIKRAYSLYWNSAVETVLTNGRIEVWGVLGNMLPLRYLASYSVFSPERAAEKSAFINIKRSVDPLISGMIQFTVTNTKLLDSSFERNYF